MRIRLFIFVAVLLMGAGEKVLHAQAWFQAYKKGTEAAQRREWPVVVEQMKKAIAEKPKEEALARAKGKTVLYVPHYWLGSALIKIGDRAGGQRELQVSQAQGVIQKTAHYADLRASLALAATEAKKGLEKGNEEAKRSADKELGLAMSAQVKATAAGATRTEGFRRASKKLQEAFAEKKSGAYERAIVSARSAATLFSGSIATAKQSTARVGPAATSAPTSIPIAIAAEEKVAAAAPAQEESSIREATPVKQEEAQVAISTDKAKRMIRQFSTSLSAAAKRYGNDEEFDLFRRRAAGASAEWQRRLSRASSGEEVAAVEAAIGAQLSALNDLTARADRAAQKSSAATAGIGAKELLEQAYRAFSRGNLAVAEELSAMLIVRNEKKLEGYMLRACARYTQSLLTGRRELETAAATDFQAALAISRSAKLDPKFFSPKIVKFFDKQRGRS